MLREWNASTDYMAAGGQRALIMSTVHETYQLSCIT